jgi:glucan phosphorylase
MSGVGTDSGGSAQALVSARLGRGAIRLIIRSLTQTCVPACHPPLGTATNGISSVRWVTSSMRQLADTSLGLAQRQLSCLQTVLFQLFALELRSLDQVVKVDFGQRRV